MKITSWSWSSNGNGTQGGAPSQAAMQQMQAMDAQMRAARIEMMAMQQHMRQMMALQQAAFAGAFASPAPQQNAVFATPVWAMPQPVVILVPAQPRPQQPQQAQPKRAPGVDI